jgi:hypothetical protein
MTYYLYFDITCFEMIYIESSIPELISINHHIIKIDWIFFTEAL